MTIVLDLQAGTIVLLKAYFEYVINDVSLSMRRIEVRGACLWGSRSSKPSTTKTGDVEVVGRK